MARKSKTAEDEAKPAGGKKGKGEKAPKAPKPAKRIDGLARTMGAVAGLAVLAWGCWLLYQGQLDMTGAGRLAVIAFIATLAVEKFIVPIGRSVVGPPADDRNS
jgi:hypothetical protein